MKDWFLRREPRERAILAIGSIAAVVIVLYALVLRPLAVQSEILRDAVAQKQRLLVDLARVGPGTGNAAASRQGNDQARIVLIPNSAREHGLAFSRTVPNGPDGIQVTFSNASFDQLVAWLASLDKDYALTVESASFQSTRQAGIVNGQLLLRRKPS
jgi:general secretion pathway protein M